MDSHKSVLRQHQIDVGNLSGSHSLPTPAVCQTPLEYRPMNTWSQKMKSRFPFMSALDLSNPALGQSLWPVCNANLSDHCVLATQNLCLSPKGNTERSVSASKLHGLGERDHQGSRSTCLTGRKGHGIIRNDNLFRHSKIEVLPARPTKGLPLESSAHQKERTQFGSGAIPGPTQQPKYATKLLGGPRSCHPPTLHARTQLQIQQQSSCINPLCGSPRIGYPHRTSN